MLVYAVLPLLPFCIFGDLFIAFFRVALVERATRKMSNKHDHKI